MSYDDDFGEEKEFRLSEVDDDLDAELGDDLDAAGMHFADEEKEEDPEDRFS